MLVMMKRILKNPVVVVLKAIFFWGEYYYFQVLAKQDFTGEMNEPFWRCLKLQMVFFLFYVVISYLIFYDNNKAGIKEIRTLYQERAIWDDFICFCFLIILICVGISMPIKFCFAYYQQMSFQLTQEMVVYIIKFMVLYLLLPLLLAILAGRAAALIQSRLAGLSVLLLTYYVFGNGFIGMLFDLFSYRNYEGWKFTTLFCFMQEDPYCIYDLNYIAPVEAIHWYRIFMWIFLVIGIVLLVTAKKRWISIALFVAAICNFICYLQPSGSMMAFRTSNGFDYIHSDMWYYEKHDTKSYVNNSRGNFWITSYDMEIEITDIVQAKATVTVSDDTLDEYQFTLYHGYNLWDITDEYGNLVPYTREGDYILVSNEAAHMGTIIFSYKGYSSNFYATTQGTYLPANFEYYPHAGWTPVYEYDYGYYAADMPETPAEFQLHVKTRADYPLYSNIAVQKCPDEGRFRCYEMKGTTDGVTLFGNPYLEENDIDGVRVICTRWDRSSYPLYNQNIENYRESFARMKEIGVDLEEITFFVAPMHNYFSYYFGTDSICDLDWCVADDAYYHFVLQSDYIGQENAEDSADYYISDDGTIVWMNQ